MCVAGSVGKDILLSLEDSAQSPVTLLTSGGVASLSLAKSLDREKAAQGGYQVTIVCERLGGRGQDFFTFPIQIRVTDVNDNSPQFLSGPFTLNISELSPVGSGLLEVVALDKDQQGPFSMVEYSVVQGNFSDLVSFRNPLDGKIVQRGLFDYEEAEVVEIVIQAQDKGDPPLSSQTRLIIHVEDADDQNPSFLHDNYTTSLPDSGNKLDISPADLKAVDQDFGLNSPVFYTFSGSGPVYSYLELNRNTGQIYVTGDKAEMVALLPTSLVVAATQYDNRARQTVTTVSLDRGNITAVSPPLRFLASQFTASILENFPVGGIVLSLATNYRADPRLVFSVRRGDLPASQFKLERNSGRLLLEKPLDFETEISFTFGVTVTDGEESDTAEVTVTVLNVNDFNPVFKYPLYDFFVSESSAVNGRKLGRIEVTDGDKDDKISLEVAGEMSRVFRVDTEGDLILHNIGYMRGSTAHVILVAQV